jgi:paraquat-inducible protein B
MAEPVAERPEIPTAVVASKARWSLSAIWLLPVVAALIGGFLAWKSYSEKGPTIHISFKTAEGLEAGKTKIKYKSVDVGVVTAIHLSPDRSRVEVDAEMVKQADAWLLKDTRFWVVRPIIRGGTVEGLGTLLSGSYIGMDVGKATEQQRRFEGLEVPPVVTADLPGRHFMLKSADLGSVGFGTPVYFRRLEVGQVVAYEMDKDGSGVQIRIFVHAPYDQYVNNQTRFWEASGVDVQFSAQGLKVETESLASIVIGGIAFQTRGGAIPGEPAPENTWFRLFKEREKALAYEDLEVISFATRFAQSVRGLSVGAPVDFRGLIIGEVKDILAQFDEQAGKIDMIVLMDIYPERLRRKNFGNAGPAPAGPRATIDKLVDVGFRAQLRTGSLLTGQLFLALDFFKEDRKQKVNWNSDPPEFPTVPSTLVELESNVAEISKRLGKVRFDEIGEDLQRALKSLDQTLVSFDQVARRVDREITPEVKQAIVDLKKSLEEVQHAVAADSPLQQDARQALQEVSKAAHSLRILTDYLEQHPEALIRGKGEPSP